MTKCNCDLCKRSRKFNRIIKKIKEFEFLKKDIKWFEDLYNHLLDVEESYDILKQEYKILIEKTGYKAYLDGTIEKIKMIDPDDWIYISGSADKNEKNK